VADLKEEEKGGLIGGRGYRRRGNQTSWGGCGGGGGVFHIATENDFLFDSSQRGGKV